MRKSYIFICLSMAIVAMGFMADPHAPLKEVKKSIALGKAKELKTEIFFTAGELNINGSSNHLSDGTYRFNIDKWKPEITYREEIQTGYLKIRTIDERENRNYNNEDNCEWDISLNKKVKNDLTVKMIAGKGTIDLQDCDLKRFEFTMAAGEIFINLRNSSVPDMTFNAAVGSGVIDLSGGIGNVNVQLVD